MLANIKKETETGEDVNAFKSLYVIQSINSEIIPDLLLPLILRTKNIYTINLEIILYF